VIYELRRYEALPGKLSQLHELMETLALPLFKKLGMQVIAFWTPVVGDDENTLIYMLGYEDMGAREEAWKAFYADPEWVSTRPKLAAKHGGPVVGKYQGTFLTPTSYSPLQ
jgi:hypothetical protein